MSAHESDVDVQEEQPEAEFWKGTSSDLTKPEKRPRPKRSLRSDSAILLGTGTLLFLSGVVLVLAPEIGEGAVRVAERLSGFGLQSGNLVLGGLVFFALGVLSRGVSKVVKSLPDASRHGAHVDAPLQQVTYAASGTDVDVGLTLEQLASDVAVLRSGSEQVASLLDGLDRRQESLLQEQRNLAAQRPEGGESGKKHDAIFQLAAGLDKLHARLDQSIGQFAAHMEQRMAKVAETVERMRSAVESGAGAGGAGRTKPASPPAKPAPPAPKAAPSGAKKSAPKPPADKPAASSKPKAAAQPTPPSPFPQHPTEGPFEDDEFEVSVELDDEFEPGTTPGAQGLADREPPRRPLPGPDITSSDLDRLLADDAALRLRQRERERGR